MKHAGGEVVSWVGEGFQHQRRSSNANNLVGIAKGSWLVHICLHSRPAGAVFSHHLSTSDSTPTPNI